MIYVIFSDIHSNLEAFQSVLEDCKTLGQAPCIILGDLVGYGANPNETIEKVLELKPKVCLRGNHDKVAAGLESAEEFNAIAQIAADWTQRALTGKNKEFLRSLSNGPIDVDGKFLASHGSPLDEDEYIFTDHEASQVFQHWEFNICFFGHTHYPVVYLLRGDKISITLPKKSRESILIEEGVRYLINPGSIGQPRDRRPEAGYALYDSESKKVTLIRVPYDYELAGERIIKAGLPSMLATRLALGL
jgi:predicted phosphodiesterase